MYVFQVNRILNEIFEYLDKEPFVGLSVIVCGDCSKLTPVKGSPAYSSATLITGCLALDLWKKFKMVELAELMKILNLLGY